MTGTHRLFPALLAVALLVAPAAVASGQGAVAGPDTTERVAADTIFGRSGRLLARFFAAPRSMEVEPIARLFGKRVQKNTSTVAVTDSASGRQLSLITLLPFADKVNGRVGDYHLGRFPAEKRAPRSAAYENPDGFIEVTLENKDTPVSEHFRLGDFLTHDQKNVWPKYLVLREALVDKLELVMVELQRRGIDAQRMRVTSGFRSPQYNQRGVGRGRARDSRHQFGDAADIVVDNNADNRLDDLNRDGRVNSKDMRILAEAVESVERQYPELIGGLGLYRANSARGPFIHVDVRGQRARWGRY
ncbi:MAG: YcbK family protein [Gemmatimonadaceae bacterium]